MKIYRVKVNGKTYEVEIESVLETPNRTEHAPLKQTEQKSLGSVVNTLKAPMQGTIVDIKAQPGDAVKRGDILIVLEAMKLENNIVAPGPGVIKEVFVSKGDAVISGQPLLSID